MARQTYTPAETCMLSHITGVQSWKEMSQEVLFVDFPHLIPRHLLHELQARRYGVGRHVLPATNINVRTLTTV